ncbi:MAG: hypothetical protein ACKOC5_04885 [Chloroflexota bacterium]
MNNQTTTLRLGIYGALINIAGILLSGPLGLILVTQLAPNPAWQSPQVWASHFHPVQTLPFFFGFLLVGGYIVMVSVTHQLAEKQERVYTTMALLFTSAFVALIFFNYINQTTFLPALARDYRPAYDPLITAFSFSNPLSLGWAIEMWGYALLGAATICTAPVFHRNRTEKITAALMVANGLVSLLTAMLAAVNLAWVFTPGGLIGYNVWNLLVMVLSIFFLRSLRLRMEEPVL